MGEEDFVGERVYSVRLSVATAETLEVVIREGVPVVQHLLMYRMLPEGSVDDVAAHQHNTYGINSLITIHNNLGNYLFYYLLKIGP